VKECIFCKEFDRTSKFLGICGVTGETVGINNSCENNCKPDVRKIEALVKEAASIYFQSNITIAEALQSAKEKY